MSGHTVTRANLADAVHNQVGLSRTDSSKLVEAILDEIVRTLESGVSVKISSFASFIIRKKKERIGRNPRTGVEAKIKPRKVVLFRPSTIMRARLNKKKG
jgi:integration host factor subunit alpha